VLLGPPIAESQSGRTEQLSKPLALPFGPGSPRRPLATERRPTWRGFGARASRKRSEKEQAKAHLSLPELFHSASAEVSFSLRRGLDSIYDFFKLSITLLILSPIRLRNDEGDPSVALDKAGMRLVS
jgi:hypothetical protein